MSSQSPEDGQVGYYPPFTVALADEESAIPNDCRKRELSQWFSIWLD